jgi:hypothetical protein
MARSCSDFPWEQRLQEERDELMARHLSLQYRYSALVDEELNALQSQRREIVRAASEAQTRLSQL